MLRLIYASFTGTGKSYLGVVMVRALLIIRDMWIKISPSVGTPPILVLSYKNHAIDEFLSDLVQMMPTKSLYNKLIRIGGQCKDFRLQPYSERHASRLDSHVHSKQQILEDLHNMKNSIHQIMYTVSTFQCFHIDIFGREAEEESKGARNDALNEVTEIIMSSLQRVSNIEEALSTFDGIEMDTKAFLKSFHFLTRNPHESIHSKHLTASLQPLIEKVKHYEYPHPGDVVYVLLGKWLTSFAEMYF